MSKRHPVPFQSKRFSRRNFGLIRKEALVSFIDSLLMRLSTPQGDGGIGHRNSEGLYWIGLRSQEGSEKNLAPT